MLRTLLAITASILLGALLGPQYLSAAPSALPAGFTRELVVDNLVSPTAFTFDGDNLLVTEKGGKVQVILPGGNIRPDPYVSLHVEVDGERGLLGITLHPKYPRKPFVYLYYTTAPGALNYSGTPENRVSRFRTINGIGTTEEILLDHIPTGDGGMHNGGDLKFGSDGLLYITTGDANVMSNAPLARSLSGKVLRIKANGAIPKKNPFHKGKVKRPEVFAMGFRNPYRFSYRRSTDTFFVGDVGWGEWEELDILKRKADYGWPTYEGPCLSNTYCDPALTDYGTTRAPWYYYSRATPPGPSYAIIAGAFAEGSNYPAPYKDAYFYADLGGWVRVLTLDGKNRITGEYPFDSGLFPVDLQTAPDGSIYLISIWNGAIFRYVYTP